MKIFLLFLVYCLNNFALCLLPPKFQWKTIDFAWEHNVREAAIASGAYIQNNNLPSGIARWKNKLFITIPRWKKGVPASLNYIYVNETQSQPLHPYPSWNEAFISDNPSSIWTNTTVVSTFRVHVDHCDRLWVVDNGVTDMLDDIRQVAPPALLVFDLNTDELVLRHVLDDDLLRESSVLNSVVVDIIDKDCMNSYAYITDMGSNAIIVYGTVEDASWRVENHFFHFDPLCGVYNVGGIDFYWSDGISSIVLLPPKKNGYRDLYFYPTSSTKLFRMSTSLLRNKDVPLDYLFTGVEVVGDRGRLSQATAVAYDRRNNVMLYTQLNRNGISCWNLDRPLTGENVPLIISDCLVMEFPNDIQVDQGGDLWILSNRQSRFLYDSMDFKQVNFRVMTIPVTRVIRGTLCEKVSPMSKAFNFVKQNSLKSAM